MPALLKYIDEDQIPELFGGTGKTRAGWRPSQTGPIPERLFRTSLDESKSVTVEVPRSSFELVKIECDRDTIIDIEFLSLSKDISFGICLLKGDEVLEEVVEVQRVDVSKKSLYDYYPKLPNF